MRDIERSLDFYRDMLGCEVVAEAHDHGRLFWCRLKQGGASFILQQAESDDLPKVGAVRGVAFYFVCEDADAMYAEFTARGLSLPQPTVADYGMKQLFVQEPDGYPVCFESPVSQASSSVETV